MRYELFEEVYSISSNDFREHRQVRVLNRADAEILRVVFYISTKRARLRESPGLYES